MTLYLVRLQNVQPLPCLHLCWAARTSGLLGADHIMHACLLQSKHTEGRSLAGSSGTCPLPAPEGRGVWLGHMVLGLSMFP
jgi:hypothetical protein